MANTTDLTLLGQRGTPRDALESAPEPVRSLYVHVPFCFHKCHYCDFYSFVDTRDRQADFVAALERELRALAPFAGPLRTLFVGGGTPSLLAPDLWRRCLDALHDLYRFEPGAELTVECNPETVTPELLAALCAGGVNRVSVGAQSFDERHLGTLERWHEPANVGRALALAADAGIHRRSLDLIFAIPGQSEGDWARDLDAALALPVDHLSAYALTYEPNTAMTRRLERGDFAPAPEDTEVAMYRHAVRALARAGLERYEVSNFARPGPSGGACRHNLAYWRQEPWLAAGPSASAHVAGWRWKNVPRLTDWMESVTSGDGLSVVVDLEAPDRARALAERAMTGLRLAEGIDEGWLDAEAGALGRLDGVRRVLERAAARGHVESEGGRVRPTDEGFLFADGVASDLIEAIAGERA